MKTIASLSISAALVIGSVSSALAAGDRFSISGVVPGVNDSTRIVLMNIERDEPVKIAEAVTTDGAFTLSECVKMPSLCKLSIMTKRKDGLFHSRTAPRMMVDNAVMKIEFLQPLDSMANSYAPESLIKVEGSEAGRQFAEYLDRCLDAEVKSKLAGYNSANKWFETKNDRDTMAKYKAIEKEAAAALLAMQKQFIAEHPDYHISSALTFKELMRTFTYSDNELTAMVETVKVCPDTARVNLSNRALEWSKRYSLDRCYPDFAVDNDKNEAKQFSSYVTPGKYTFIDFWASWCGPCRSAIPHVRKLRSQYADKMNVYSISVDDDEAAWRKAMEHEQMEWTQLRLNPQQIDAASRLYYISTIPRLILLDSMGRIVCSTNLPDEIDEYLSKNLK